MFQAVRTSTSSPLAVLPVFGTAAVARRARVAARGGGGDGSHPRWPARDRQFSGRVSCATLRGVRPEARETVRLFQVNFPAAGGSVDMGPSKGRMVSLIGSIFSKRTVYFLEKGEVYFLA